MKKKSKISGYILRATVAALLLSCVTIGLSSAINVTNDTPEASASEHNTAFGVNAHEGAASAEASAIQRNSTLTFADRVAYQRAIEEVYWRHRIWPAQRPDPKPSLDAVMSQAQLEKKVADYLRNSQALEDYWKRPITPDQLQAEMDRMAQHTKQPEVLRELFEALGNDPFVIAECLARPVLTERLTADLSAQDKTNHAQAARTNGLPGMSMATTLANVAYTLPKISQGVPCTDDTWTATSTTNAPTARIQHTAVWTGSEMIVWGGFSPSGGTYFNTGGKYSPATDSWTPTSTTNAPSARYIHTAVWTRSEMTIWGGGGVSGNVDTGGRYDPATDGWAPTSTINAPSARTHHTAVWTGSEMIVWGGVGNGFPFPYFNTGGRYCAPGPPARLGNVSTRAFVETGDNVTIGGFIVQGTQPKRVIIRALGPELTQYGVPDPLANPTLELHDGTGALIASNNNWRTTIIGGIITANQVQDIRNSGYAPGDELESAIIADLAPGNYTAIMRGVNNMTGVGLVEVYDLRPETNSILGNISTRSFVQTGDNVMIGGFIVQGTTTKRVIIRAIGPELGAPPFNVPNALSDPTLELHDGTRALIASNDNWQHTIIGGIITADQVSAIQSSGKAPGNASESAIIATLPPGNYTAIVRGKNNTTGVALVEVYDLQ
jgi:hypothetical protein